MQLTSTIILMNERNNFGRLMKRETFSLKKIYGQPKMCLSTNDKCQRISKLFMAGSNQCLLVNK